MKTIALFSICAFLLFQSEKSHATTWDEPWADQVIKQAGSFILGKVISADPDKGIRLVVIKTLGGKSLKDTILISNFYALRLCSSSGDHGAGFKTDYADSCYFLINENNKGEYCIATPTTGFDNVEDGKVFATYRHSYHQASVPVALYEKTMTAIFNNYHDLPYEKDFIEKFVTETLSQKPAGFSKTEIDIFFRQHVALECVYHLRLTIDEKLAIPFLQDKKNFHNQVSAARAMRAFNTESNKKALLNAAADTSKRNFVRVICTWSLAELNPADLKMELQKIAETASDENDGFGGNIMDSRVCTHIPSLKEAVEELLGKL